MARRLWLHIGMHKTGSSSIQSAMRGYDDGRVAYLDWPDENHSHLMGCAFREADVAGQVRRGFARDTAEYLAVADVLRARLAERLAASDRDIVISAEDLTTGIDAADVRRLLDFMARFFDEVRVIAYVRDAPSYVISAFQEIQKVQVAPFSLPELVPGYQERFGPWEDAVGRDAMTYVPFSRRFLHAGDVVTDFAVRLGLAELAADVRANGAMSAEAVAVIFAAWRLPFVGAAKRAGLVKCLLPRLEGFGSHRLGLTAAAVDEVRRLAAQDIAWMEARLGVPLVPPQPSRLGPVARVGSPAGLWFLVLRAVVPLGIRLAWRALRAGLRQ